MSHSRYSPPEIRPSSLKLLIGIETFVRKMAERTVLKWIISFKKLRQFDQTEFCPIATPIRSVNLPPKALPCRDQSQLHGLLNGFRVQYEKNWSYRESWNRVSYKFEAASSVPNLIKLDRNRWKKCYLVIGGSDWSWFASSFTNLFYASSSGWSSFRRTGLAW